MRKLLNLFFCLCCLILLFSSCGGTFAPVHPETMIVGISGPARSAITQHPPTVAAAAIINLDQKATVWGLAHPYHDTYDNNNYLLDAGYTSYGISGIVDPTTQDYLNAYFNLQMMETNYTDHTPYNKEHATDMQLLTHYGLQDKQVLMVSLIEQVMRVYQNKRLVRAFYVTTGRMELPSLPGEWSVLSRISPTIFTSGYAPSSPYWYPDTLIHYAIGYHTNGYFLHDAYWRSQFGPGTEFPHNDLSAPGSSDNGSHGCISLSLSDMAWVYNTTDYNTIIVIY